MSIRSLVPKHPIPMKTVFRTCFLANFSIDAHRMQSVLPTPIEADLYKGRAHLSVVIADMRHMRPAFLPEIFGISYDQVVYRVVVRCQGERGVHFLRSDANNKLMCIAGDWLTSFRFHFSQIEIKRDGPLLHFDLVAGAVPHADIHASYDIENSLFEMPPSSDFPNLEEAQKHLVELFAAFSVDSRTGKVNVVHIKRGPWKISLVNDLRADYQFMKLHDPFNSETARLDSVFYVEELPYYWYRLNQQP